LRRIPDRNGGRSSASTHHVAIDPRSRPVALPSSRSVDAVSSLPLHLSSRLKCCDHPLNPPSIDTIGGRRLSAVHRSTQSYANCIYLTFFP
jgi:hypothetical protein